MDYTGDDIYCDVIIPGKVAIKIVHESGHVLAYHHTKPSWPVHIVVTPKVHIASLLTLVDANNAIKKDILYVISLVAEQVTKEHGACRVITNLGDYQDSKHLHFHIISGEKLQQ